MKPFKIVQIILILMAAAALAYAVTLSDNSKDKKGRDTVMEEKQKNLQTATFAGGCFWCVEADFEKVDGVVEVISGYTGGRKVNPKYDEVSAGGTGHVEAVQVIYDPGKGVSLLTGETQCQVVRNRRYDRFPVGLPDRGGDPGVFTRGALRRGT